MAQNFIKLPDGGIVNSLLIEIARPTKSGVICYDRYMRMVAIIKLKNLDHLERVVEIMSEIVSMRSKATQPDWAFLNEESDTSA